MRLAINDAGAGYASLYHIVQLQPDLVKLDQSLVRDIDTIPARRALTAAMLRFSREIGATLMAEGVETPEELSVLTDIGVTHVQGYLLARPGPLAAAQAFIPPLPGSSAAPATRQVG